MLELKNITKSYKTGDFKQEALKNINLKFSKNEFVAILGPSGSGKTTLLNIIGGLDHYDTGDLIINKQSTKKFKSHDWDFYRNNCIGFIFQNYNLINHISILSNVEMGMTLSGKSLKARKQKAKEVLNLVGLKEHIYKKPNQLSGGQMQRVAIARALANNPDIILADEPTGALDTTTSVQIMELIKEIAKDKLVIMVTHNPTLARSYASRVIEMQDGKIIQDTRSAQEENILKKAYKIKKTSMTFFSALSLSLNNICTKKGRTLLTAFASSIGIIGIALILSLSNGFDKQIDYFEKSALSSMPIVISEQNRNLEEEMQNSLQTTEEEDYSEFSYVVAQKSTDEDLIHTNHIQKEYVNYLEKANPEDVHSLSYTSSMGFHLLNKLDGKVKLLEDTFFSSIPKNLDNKSVLFEKYDLLAGREATKKDELILVVDSKNHVSDTTLEALGFPKQQETVSFDTLLNATIKIAFNNDFYQKAGKYYIRTNDLESLYSSKNTLTLKVVGIIRLKEEYEDYMEMPTLLYTDSLIDYALEKNKSSKIVAAQKKADYNVLSGEVFDLTTEKGLIEKEKTLAYLGEEDIPMQIQIFPKDFASKERLLTYLNAYNENKKVEDQIIYTDEAQMVSSLSSNIMDAITIVLVAFSAISLIVSSIMIGVIMYISVLERTKEIGILRSLGARKKDIARVFNAEVFLIGLTSGLLGIFLTKILLIPINHLLYQLTELKQMAILNPIHAILLVGISLILTLVGGALPAKVASKKDPVVALRSE